MLQSYQRSIFQKELTDRLKYWLSPDSKTEFYKDSPAKPGLGIQRTSSGYYYLSSNLVFYCDLTNGLIVRIKRFLNSTDWNSYTDLYKISNEQNKFRMDIPLYRELITVFDGSRWEYVELKSPNNEYGKNLYDDLFSDSYKTLEEEKDSYLNDDWESSQASDSIKFGAKELFEEYIDQFAIIAGIASSIAKKNNIGLPPGIASISALYRDTKGYFWSDFDHNTWNVTKNLLIDSALIELEGTTDFAEKAGLLDSVVRENLIKYAREKWTAI